MHTRPLPVLALVGQRNQPAARRELLRGAPQRRDLDAIDPVAPGVPGRVHRLVEAVGELERVERTAGHLAHLSELRLDSGQNVGRQSGLQVSAQDTVVVVLIPERRGGWLKGGMPLVYPANHPAFRAHPALRAGRAASRNITPGSIPDTRSDASMRRTLKWLALSAAYSSSR